VVVAFNLSPKRHIEGALVETKNGTVQLNLPRREGTARPPAMRARARGRPGLPVELASAGLSSVMPETRAARAGAT